MQASIESLKSEVREDFYALLSTIGVDYDPFDPRFAPEQSVALPNAWTVGLVSLSQIPRFLELPGIPFRYDLHIKLLHQGPRTVLWNLLYADGEDACPEIVQIKSKGYLCGLVSQAAIFGVVPDSKRLMAASLSGAAAICLDKNAEYSQKNVEEEKLSEEEILSTAFEEYVNTNFPLQAEILIKAHDQYIKLFKKSLILEQKLVEKSSKPTLEEIDFFRMVSSAALGFLLNRIYIAGVEHIVGKQKQQEMYRTVQAIWSQAQLVTDAADVRRELDQNSVNMATRILIDTPHEYEKVVKNGKMISKRNTPKTWQRMDEISRRAYSALQVPEIPLAMIYHGWVSITSVSLAAAIPKRLVVRNLAKLRSR